MSMLRTALVRVKGLQDDYQSKTIENNYNKKTLENLGVEDTIERANLIDRTNSICKITIDNSGISKEDKVLDIGCYTGFYEYLFEKMGYRNFVGIDISEEAIGIANKVKTAYSLNSTFLVGDAEDLAFPDNNFDIVLFFGILHHLPKKSMLKSLGEARRVLKPGGKVVVAEPNLWNLKMIINHLSRDKSGNELPYSHSDMIGYVSDMFTVKKSFTRLFVPRNERFDSVLGRLPIIRNFGSQSFIVGVCGYESIA